MTAYSRLFVILCTCLVPLIAEADASSLKIFLGKLPKGSHVLVARDQEIKQAPGVNPLRFWQLSDSLADRDLFLKIAYAELENKRYKISVKLLSSEDGAFVQHASASYDINPKLAEALKNGEIFLDNRNRQKTLVRFNGFKKGGVLEIKIGNDQELKKDTIVSEFSPLWKWIPSVVK